MLKWKEFYQKTELENPSIILKKFFEMKLDNTTLKRVIDLGCGSGNDTIYLLKKNYFVTAVDKEQDVIDIIKNRISDTSNLKFIIEKFENIKLEENQADLVVSNLSIYFCNPKFFEKFCNEFTNAISKNGYFVGNFLGKEDEWSKDTNRTFVNEKEIKDIFKDFNIIYFNEKKYKKITAKGNMKFWHVYEIIAKKL